MIHDLKPYPVMKDSGVPWLGKVPEHWRELPGKLCYREKKVPNMGLKETTVLSLSYGQIVVKPVDKLHGLVPASFETYQIVDAGNIIVRPTDLQNDWNSLRFGLSRHRGIITSAYMCLLTTDTMMQDYGHLLLHAYDLKKVFYGLGSGLRQNLDWRDFKYLPCVVPPLPEQSAIVRFLDHADRRIRKYIRIKQKLITLLEEQKRAIIHHTVTRGLDPNVRLKPSGVEWLGDVPEHWEVRKVGAVSTRVTKGTTPTTLGRGFTDAGIRFVKVESISKDRTLIAALCAHIDADTDALLARSRLRVGDVLVAIAGAIGRVAVVFEEDLPANCNQAVAIVTPITAYVLSDWLAFVLASPACQRFLTDSSVQSAQANLSLADLRGTMISLPPMPEQGRIVGKLVETTAAIARAAASAQREISLLHEYRTRLIADVVTGKLDVREAAANLPEETEEPEPPDEADALSVAEETEVVEEPEE